MARKLAREAAQDAQKRPQAALSPGTRPKTGRSPVFRGVGPQLVQMAGRPEQNANPTANLDRLVEELMEPIGRQARRRAANTIRQQQGGFEPHCLDSDVALCQHCA